MAWTGKSIDDASIPALDKNLWEARTGPSSLIDDDESLAEDWRPEYTKMIWRVYRLWLGWLHANGILDHLNDPGARCTSERVIAYVHTMRKRKNTHATIRFRINHLERAMAVLAPELDRKFLRTIIKNLPKGGNNARKRARLQETAVLVQLGIDLMRTADALDASAIKRAVGFRDGLQISLLALRPFRRSNFISMEIGIHLVCRGSQWWIRYSEEETKDGCAIEVQFPQELVEWLERYLDHYRPILAGNSYTGQRLWLSSEHRPQDGSTLYRQVVRQTENAFGIGKGLNPHLFRDALATTLAIDHPEIVGISHVMLGNSVAVCQKIYNLAQTHKAGRSLRNSNASMRERLRKKYG